MRFGEINFCCPNKLLDSSLKDSNPKECWYNPEDTHQASVPNHASLDVTNSLNQFSFFFSSKELGQS